MIKNLEFFDPKEFYVMDIDWVKLQRIDRWSDSYVFKSEKDWQVRKFYSLSSDQFEQYYKLMQLFNEFLEKKFENWELEEKILVRKPTRFVDPIDGRKISVSDFIGWHTPAETFLKEKIIIEKIRKLLWEFLGIWYYKLHPLNIRFQEVEWKTQVTIIDIWNQIPKFLKIYENPNTFNLNKFLEKIVKVLS